MSTLVLPEYETEFRLRLSETGSLMPNGSHSKSVTNAIHDLIVQLENDVSLEEVNRLRERLDALDRLDVYLPCMAQGEAGSARFGQELFRRARRVHDRLEAINADLYAAIRCQIQHGLQPYDLLRWLPPLASMEVEGVGYDSLDELISGVFQMEQPEDEHLRRDPERLFYQPTPARHIFRLIGLTALTSEDVFVDIGSGLGHVPMMVSICTKSRSFGVEYEATYAERSQQCARELNLKRVAFLQQDARDADLSDGTVFYLYTPFLGSILCAMLKRLRREAATRQIRICCYGPCTSIVAGESWLVATTPLDANLITVFCSRV